MSDDAKRRPEAPDELRPAAGTPDAPVQPGERQAGDPSEQAQALGGPVDIAPGRDRHSTQGEAKNLMPPNSAGTRPGGREEAPDPDEEVDLVVSLATVVGIIDAARAVGELGEEAANEEVQDPELPEDIDPDAMADSLKGLIDALNEDEQAALIALAWIGRGDFDASGWSEALRLAQERNEAGTAAEYLVGMELLGDYLAEGVAAFGHVAEDVAR